MDVVVLQPALLHEESDVRRDEIILVEILARKTDIGTDHFAGWQGRHPFRQGREHRHLHMRVGI